MAWFIFYFPSAAVSSVVMVLYIYFFKYCYILYFPSLSMPRLEGLAHDVT